MLILNGKLVLLIETALVAFSLSCTQPADDRYKAVSPLIPLNCPEGQIHDSKSGQCVAPPPTEVKCPEGKVFDDTFGQCLIICKQNEVRDGQGSCFIPVKKCIPTEYLDDKGVCKEKPVEVSTVPTFIKADSAVPLEVRMKEGESWSLDLPAKDPQNDELTYIFQCPYNCPTGFTADDMGSFSWSAGYDQAGIFDIRFLAVNSKGDSAVTHYLRFFVENINRAPKVDSITITEKNDLSYPIIICNVAASDPDNDFVNVQRSWYVNGVMDSSLVGYSQERRKFNAFDHITCSAIVKDNESTIYSQQSQIYIVPNNVPVFTKNKLINKVDSSQNIFVGSSVSCDLAASDLDGQATYFTEIYVKNYVTGETLASGNSLAPLVYVVPKTIAHIQLACAARVSDGYANSEMAYSAPVKILNSAPRITSMKLYTTGGSILMTDREIKCKIEFDDPDGDVVVPSLTFYNGQYSRGTGVVSDNAAAYRVNSYLLKHYFSVDRPIDADIHYNTMGCGATIQDITSSSIAVSGAANTMIVQDSPPSLMFISGNFIQDNLATDDTPATVHFKASDLDGDSISWRRSPVTEGMANCDDPEIKINPSLTELTQSVSFGKIPSSPYPQKDRDCAVAYQIESNGVSSSPLQISLKVPNHAPRLECDGSDSNVTQYLKTAEENYLRAPFNNRFDYQRIGFVPFPAGDGVPRAIICQVIDSDSPEATSYSFKILNNGCRLAFLGDSDFSSTEDRSSILIDQAKIDGYIELDACISKIQVSDGALSSSLASNEVQVSLKPLIDVSLAPGYKIDSSCRLSLAASPVYAPYYSFFAEDPVPDMFGETQVNGYLFTKNDDPIEYLDSLSLSQNTLRARLRESALYSHADITFDKQIDAAWTFKARNQQLTDGNITERTVRKRYNLTKSIPLTVAEVSAYAPLEPRFAGVGRDLTEGRQASPTSGCMVGDCDYTTRGSISAGRYHTCALSSSGGSGLVWCWGRNDDHQLGLSNEDGSEKIDIAGQMIDIRSAIISPVEGLNDKGAGSGDSAISIISGDLHSCAVMNDSSIKCWGSDNYGQLGRANSYYNDTIASSSVSFSSADYVIDSERYAADSGSLAFIALANDTTYLKNVYSIAAGEAHSCALLGGEEESGRVKCWGKNDSGQLGLGSTPLVHLFPAAPLPAANNCTHKNLHCETRARYVRDPLDSTKPLEGVVSLAVGGNSSCAVLKSGRVYCWGANPYGMLGNSLSTDMDQAPTLKPKAVSGISSVWMLSMDSFSSCAISDPGVINCWGLGLDGQLGTGLSQVLASPRLDLSLNRPAAAISHGGKTTCTLSLDQSVSCVGSNSKKQLGAEESAANSLVFKPVKIKETQASSSISLSGAVAITTGLYHSCALLVDGAIACWGDGLYGQRGSSLSGSTYEAPAYASIVINANNPTERFRVSTLSCPAGVRKYLLNEVMSP